MRLRSPSQVRVDPAALEPLEVHAPELAAPLARAIHNAKCPACGASMTGVLDASPDGGSQVQVICFGDPAHVFIFDSTSGRLDNAPTVKGTLRSESPASL